MQRRDGRALRGHDDKATLQGGREKRILEYSKRKGTCEIKADARGGGCDLAVGALELDSGQDDQKLK